MMNGKMRYVESLAISSGFERVLLNWMNQIIETVRQEAGELLSVEEPLKTQSKSDKIDILFYVTITDTYISVILSYQRAFTAVYALCAIDAVILVICLWRVRVGGFTKG